MFITTQTERTLTPCFVTLSEVSQEFICEIVQDFEIHSEILKNKLPCAPTFIQGLETNNE